MMEYYAGIKNTVKVLFKNPALTHLSRLMLSFPLRNKLQDAFVPLCQLFLLPPLNLPLAIELYAYRQPNGFVPECVYTLGTCPCNNVI